MQALQPSSAAKGKQQAPPRQAPLAQAASAAQDAPARARGKNGWAEGLDVEPSEQKAPGAAVQGVPVPFLTLALLGWGEAVAVAEAEGTPEGAASRLA